MSEKVEENNIDKIKSKLLKKLLAVVIKDGFQSLRMDDIAKCMDVSRATMYKYFSSKEEVIEGLVDILDDYIKRLIAETHEETESAFGLRFQHLFGQSVLLAANITDIFLRELQAIYPDLYNRLKDGMQAREKQMIEFYRDGMTKGIFNTINEKIILLQDDILTREIINIKYLMLNQLSLQQALFDFYSIKKLQLFKTEKLLLIDDSIIDPIIDHIVKKCNQNL